MYYPFHVNLNTFVLQDDSQSFVTVRSVVNINISVEINDKKIMFKE